MYAQHKSRGAEAAEKVVDGLLFLLPCHRRGLHTYIHTDALLSKACAGMREGSEKKERERDTAIYARCGMELRTLILFSLKPFFLFPPHFHGTKAKEGVWVCVGGWVHLPVCGLCSEGTMGVSVG